MKHQQVTIQDIANELGITASTVSRALQGNTRISIETRNAVIKLAKKWNYRANTVASNLRTGKAKVIGVIVPRINRHFFSNVIGGIETIVQENGFNVVICQSEENLKKEIDAVDALLNLRVAGIIASISAETKTYNHFKNAINNGIPIVMFDRIVEELKLSSVTLNDYTGAFKATEHLILKGCEKIAHLGGPQHLNVYKQRYLGYIDALKKHKQFSSQLPYSFKALTKDEGYTVAKKWLLSKEKPDAIFAASDYSALGAVMAANELNIKIPKQLSIVGFANEPFTEFMSPTLSSVEQHGWKMGETVAQLFFEELNSAKENKTKNIIIEPELIIRNSS